MPRHVNDTDMSELEREFELEMEEDEELEFGEEGEMEEDEEFEAEFEEPEEEFEEPEEEFEGVEGESTNDYAERFYELSQREYESESEVDGAVNEVLDDMEREYFWKSIKKGWKKFKKGALGKLVNKGLKLAAGQVPGLQALKGITQLARGDLKGLLGSLAKAGLSSAIPGGGVALDALKTLGFKKTEDPEENKEAWDNYVNASQKAFEYLAGNLDERIDDPIRASELANKALKTALTNVSVQRPSFGVGRKRRRVIEAHRGDIIVIKIR